MFYNLSTIERGYVMIIENIRRLADAKGLSIRAVERKAGLSNGTIGKWDEHSPSVENLAAVASVLKVTVNRLLKEQ